MLQMLKPLPKPTPPELLRVQEVEVKAAYAISKEHCVTRKTCRHCLNEYKAGERKEKPPLWPIDTNPAIVCPVCGGVLSDIIPF